MFSNDDSILMNYKELEDKVNSLKVNYNPKSITRLEFTRFIIDQIQKEKVKNSVN